MADLRLGIDASKAKRGGQAFNNQLDRIQRNTKQTQRQLRRTTQSMDKFGQSVQRAGRLLAALAIAFATRELIGLSDSFTRLTNAVRITVDSQEELAAVTSAIFDIAFRTRAPVESLGVLYGRAALAADALGASQVQLLQFTEGVGKALAIQGTSAAESRGALLQLGQAIGSSIVRAEEFNSLIEGARPILIAVAANLDETGVSLTQLRQRVIEGKLSSKAFFDAFLKGTKDLDDLFKRTAPTIGQGFEAIRTGAILAVGQFNLLTGASSDLAMFLQGIGRSIGTNLLPALVGLSTQASILFQTFATGSKIFLESIGVLGGLSGEFTRTTTILSRAVDRFKEFPITILTTVQLVTVSILSFFEMVALRLLLSGESIKGFLLGVLQSVIGFIARLRGLLPDTVAALLPDFDALNTKVLALQKKTLAQRTQFEARLASIDDRALAQQNKILAQRVESLQMAEDEAQKVRDLFKQNLEALTRDLAGIGSEVGQISKQLQQLISSTSTPLQAFTAQFAKFQAAIKDGLPLGNFQFGIGQLISQLAASSTALGEFGDAFDRALGEGVDPAALGFLRDLGLGVEEFQMQLRAFQAINPAATIEEFIVALGLAEDATIGAMSAQDQLNLSLQVYRDLLQAGIIDQAAFDAAQLVLQNKFKATADVLTEFAKQAARNIQDAFADFLFDPFEDGLRGLAFAFANTLKKIAAEILANIIITQFFKALQNVGGPVGAFASAGLGAIGSSQSGQPIGSRETRLVGEQGPELFRPRTAGSITRSGDSMEALMPTINNTVIVDPRGFTEALATPVGGRDLVNAITVNKNAIKAALQ